MSTDFCLIAIGPILWILRNVSTQISLHTPRRLIRADTFSQKIHRRQKVSVRISLRSVRMLILIDTLRRVHHVGFLMEGLISAAAERYLCKLQILLVWLS